MTDKQNKRKQAKTEATETVRKVEREQHSERFGGGREAMLKERTGNKARLQAIVDDILEHWDGGPIALFTTVDTDGEGSVHSRAIVGGVGSVFETRKLIENIVEELQNLVEQVTD